jgi:formate dehydrogenase maturation protein FdhE
MNMAITTSMINQDAMLRGLMEKMNAEMMAAAEPVIKKAAEDAEKEMRKRLGAMFVSLLEKSFSIERNQNELRILVKHEVPNA